MEDIESGSLPSLVDSEIWLWNDAITGGNPAVSQLETETDPPPPWPEPTNPSFDFFVSRPSRNDLRLVPYQLEVAPEPSPGPSPQPLSVEEEVFQLRNKNAELRQENIVLETKYNTLFVAFTHLAAGRVPSQPTHPSPGTSATWNTRFDVSLNRSDFPNVRFWFKRDWMNFNNAKKTRNLKAEKGKAAVAEAAKAAAGAQATLLVVNDSEPESDSADPKTRGKARASQGINVMMLYAESPEGESVDGDTATYIRLCARTLWEKYKKEGVAPATWGQATTEVRSDYCRQMVEQFPLLRLCSNNWKAIQIATDGYSNWYQKQKKKMLEVEEIEESEGGQSGASQNKRSRRDSESMKIVQKRTRMRFAHDALTNPGLPVVTSLDSEPGVILGRFPVIALPDSQPPFQTISRNSATDISRLDIPTSESDRVGTTPVAGLAQSCIDPSILDLRPPAVPKKIRKRRDGTAP